MYIELLNHLKNTNDLRYIFLNDLVFTNHFDKVYNILCGAGKIEYLEDLDQLFDEVSDALDDRGINFTVNDFISKVKDYWDKGEFRYAEVSNSRFKRLKQAPTDDLYQNRIILDYDIHTIMNRFYPEELDDFTKKLFKIKEYYDTAYGYNNIEYDGLLEAFQHGDYDFIRHQQLYRSLMASRFMLGGTVDDLLSYDGIDNMISEEMEDGLNVYLRNKLDFFYFSDTTTTQLIVTERFYNKLKLLNDDSILTTLDDKALKWYRESFVIDDNEFIRFTTFTKRLRSWHTIHPSIQS